MYVEYDEGSAVICIAMLRRLRKAEYDNGVSLCHIIRSKSYRRTAFGGEDAIRGTDPCVAPLNLHRGRSATKGTLARRYDCTYRQRAEAIVDDCLLAYFNNCWPSAGYKYQHVSIMVAFDIQEPSPPFNSINQSSETYNLYFVATKLPNIPT